MDFTTAFAVWAAVVALVGGLIVFELVRLRDDLKELSVNLGEYILHMERRATHTETFLSLKHADYQPIVREK